MVALRERSFSVDFRDRGVQYGHVWTADLNLIALAIQHFVEGRACIDELVRAVPVIEIASSARPHEKGILVDFQWDQYLGTRPSTWPEDMLYDVFVVAARGRLRKLMPFTSLSRACFSTTTGFPYTNDCPAIEVMRGGDCRVFCPGEMDTGNPVFTGTPRDAVARTETLLSSTIVAARDGTADDAA